jgi:hypothetical protein
VTTPRLTRGGVAVAATLAAALAGACGSSSGLLPADAGVTDGGRPLSDGGAADAGVSQRDAGLPLAQACETLNRERCAYLQRCGLVGDAPAETGRCAALLAATWCGPGTWPSRVAPGVDTLRYDALLAHDCASAFAERPCAEHQSLPASCGAFLKPAANLRQPCYDGFQECAEGVCRGAACPRTCQPRGITGEVCRVDADCVTQLFCRPSATTPGVGTCIAYAGLDEPCDPDTRCLEGLSCLQSQCRRLPTAGGACLAGRCDEQSLCDAALDGGTCVPRRPRGAACAPGQCLPGLICLSLTGACEPRALGQAGAACALEQDCPPGTGCIGATPSSLGACEPLRQDGAACARHDDCLPHLACLHRDGGATCERRRALDSACGDARECGAQATCAQGRCVALPLPEEACTTAGACLWGACVTTQAMQLTCVAPQGPGAPCAKGGDCASGRCTMGACLAPCGP